MDKELYINGEIVDLGDDTVIALTKQVNDIADVQTTFGDFTNEFTLPFTQRNNEIFGLANAVQSGGNIPYTRIQVKIVDKGVEVVPSGYAILRQAKDGYKISIYQNNSDLFASLSGLNLRDIDYSDLNHIWSRGIIAASRSNTTGYKYSIIDYGRMSPSGVEVNSEELFPSWFTGGVVERIINAAGWTLEGDVLTDELYTKLKLDFSNDSWERPETEMDIYRALTQADGVQTFNYIRDSESGIPALYYPFPITLLDNGPITGDVYVTPHNIRNNFNINIVMDYAYAGNPTGTEGLVRLVIYNLTQATEVKAWTIFIFTGDGIGDDPTGTYGNGTNPPTVNDFVFANGELPFPNAFIEEGDEIEFRIEVTAEFDLDINVTVFQLSIEPNKQIGNSEYYVLQNQLPEMSQVDFLNSIMNIFGVVPDSVSYNKTLVFKSYNQLIENQAEDMSELYSEEDDPIDFHPSGYAQENKFIWDNDDVTQDDLGNSSFTIADESLDLEADVVSLQFGASDMVRRLNSLNVPLIKKVSYGDGFDYPTGDYNVSPIPPPFVETTVHVDELILEPTSIRLSIDDTQDLDYNVIYSDTEGSSIFSNNVPLCYFFLSDKTINLHWDYLLDTYYPVFIQMLQKYKKISPNFTLKSPQVQNFDHFKPWYLNKYSAKFFPMRISNYKNGQLTSVELIKI